MSKWITLIVLMVLMVAPLSAADRYLDVIVQLQDDHGTGMRAANRAAAVAVAHEHGVEPRHSYGTALVGFAARIPEARLQALRNDPRIKAVEFDRPAWAVGGITAVSLASTPQVVPWGIARIGADVNANEGAGIHVYVLDTGIDTDHPDLQAHIGNCFAVETCRGRNCPYPWEDDNGHGTHVAGTIGAIDNDIDVLGVASQVTLHGVKVLAKSGSGSVSGIVAGIDWVASEVAARGEAAVVNMSIAGSGSKTGTCTSAGFVGTDVYHEAICNATNVGVVFAIAAGNADSDAAAFQPAAFDDTVITVSATTSTDDWASFSNWGDDTAAWTPNASAPVAIAAPGVSVLSTWNDGGTRSISGTSMAAPHVAGAVALVLASNPQAADFSAFENVRSTLLATAESTDTFSNTTGDPHEEDFLDAGSL